MSWRRQCLRQTSRKLAAVMPAANVQEVGGGKACGKRKEAGGKRQSY
jgi:hypothetical protein